MHLNNCLNLMKDESKYRPVIPFRDTKLSGFIGQSIRDKSNRIKVIFMIDNQSINNEEIIILQ